MTTIERPACHAHFNRPGAVRILARTSLGLMLHGLAHPLRTATIDRRTGRVTAR